MDIVIPEFQNQAGPSRGTVVGESSRYQLSVSGICPVLFLIFINDLPEDINSSTRLFADDCILYRQISSENDQKLLQEDLDRLATWEKTWGMEFHPQKCSVMRISRARTPRNLPIPPQRCTSISRTVIKIPGGGSAVHPIIEKSYRLDN